MKILSVERARAQRISVRAMHQMLACLLVIALTSSTFGQVSPADQKRINSVKKKVAACVDKQRRVVIETYDNRRFQGAISEAGETDFSLIYAGRVTTLPYSDVKAIRWHSGAWKQVELIAGVAAVLGGLLGAVILLGGLKG